MAPIELIATEKEKIWNCTNAVELTQIRKQTTSDWQTMWDSASNGRWSNRLLSNVKRWTSRKYGNLNQYIAQVLTGHGCFGDYLHNYKIWTCLKVANHATNKSTPYFECDAWSAKRGKLNAELGENLTPESIGSRMIKNRKSWDLNTEFLEDVMATKTKEERTQQQQQIIVLYPSQVSSYRPKAAIRRVRGPSLFLNPHRGLVKEFYKLFIILLNKRGSEERQ